MKTSSKVISALLVIGIIVLLNYLVGGLSFFNKRFDFTEDKLYTLSDGTKNIIGRLNADKPVTIRFYATTEDRIAPPVIQSYARTVTDLLLEFEKEADGKIILEKLAPNPDTDEEDKAREDDIRGMQVNQEGDNLYLGMAVQCLQQKEVLPFLNPQEETSLEYQIARSINKVSKSGKTSVGVMSAMPVMGDPDPMAQFRGGSQAPPAWFFVQQLKMDYDVRNIALTAEKIDDDVQVLIVLHPGGIDDTGMYAIDQFLMRGGKLIAFCDPKSMLAEAMSQQQMQNPMMRGQSNMINTQSNMKKLFDSWGVTFDPDQVVVDLNSRAQMGGRSNPTALLMSGDALNRENRLTKDLNSLVLLTAGAFSMSAKEGINQQVLLQSSENATTISVAQADELRRQSLKSFTASGRKFPLIVQLSGKFKTAFPDGKPKPADKPKVPGETGGPEQDAAAPTSPTPQTEVATPAATTPASAPASPEAPAAPAVPALAQNTAPAPVNDGTVRESKGDPFIMLFSDADMMFDDLYMQRTQIGNIESSSNLSLLLGAVEQLSGGGDLIAVRNRASTTRPFTTRDKRQSEIEAEYRPQMTALESELQEAQGKLSSLRGTVDKESGRIIPTPEAQADIDNWVKKQKDVEAKIREIKKAQRRDLDGMDMNITLMNFLLVPLALIIVGLVSALRRRSATAAK
jgi:ABC-type uncharacterized transport system involved in gliding motility auxiliary subunit